MSAVPVGYKQTEIGVIPEDWNAISLDDMNPFITSGSRGWAEFYSDRGAPFIRITNMSRDSIYLCLTDLKLVNLPAGENEGLRTQLQNDDVLISITADIGIVSYVDQAVTKPAYINQHIALVRFDPIKLNSKFVSYYLAGADSQRNFRSATDGGAKAGMSLNGIRKIKFALPPTTTEQTAIANALSDTDALIHSLQKLIAKKRQIKQGAMQTLLNPYENGVLKAGWAIKKLDDLCDVRDGTHESPKFKPQGIPFVTSKNIVDGRIDLQSVNYISEEDAVDFNRRSKVDKGDILMSMIGTIGNALLVESEPDYCIKNVALIKPRKINSIYLIQLINSPLFQEKLSDNLNGGIQKFISLGVLRNIAIEVPTLESQTLIAAVLTDINAEITALETKLTKYQQIKQGMMQNLLTGRIRLI